LPHLEEWNNRRRSHRALYDRLLAGTPVTLVQEIPECRPVYHLMVIRAPHRDELQAFLKEREIFTGIHYPIPIHLQKAVEGLRYHVGDFPVTEQAVNEILSLPMYAELTDDEIKFIVETIKAFYAG